MLGATQGDGTAGPSVVSLRQRFLHVFTCPNQSSPPPSFSSSTSGDCRNLILPPVCMPNLTTPQSFHVYSFLDFTMICPSWVIARPFSVTLGSNTRCSVWSNPHMGHLGRMPPASPDSPPRKVSKPRKYDWIHGFTTLTFMKVRFHVKYAKCFKLLFLFYPKRY